MFLYHYVPAQLAHCLVSVAGKPSKIARQYQRMINTISILMFFYTSDPVFTKHRADSLFHSLNATDKYVSIVPPQHLSDSTHTRSDLSWRTLRKSWDSLPQEGLPEWPASNRSSRIESSLPQLFSFFFSIAVVSDAGRRHGLGDLFERLSFWHPVFPSQRGPENGTRCPQATHSVSAKVIIDKTETQEKT